MCIRDSPGRAYPQTVPLALEEQRVGRVAVERRRDDVEERDPDVVHFAPVDLGGIGVRELVDAPDDREEQEELDRVEERLGEKRVELEGPAPDRAPVLHEDAHGPERPCLLYT